MDNYLYMLPFALALNSLYDPNSNFSCPAALLETILFKVAENVEVSLELGDCQRLGRILRSKLENA
jgi:hypothetical protein